MDFEFTDLDLKKIAETLDVEQIHEENHVRFVLDDKKSGRKLSLEIYNQIPIGKTKGNLISVYTNNTHLQLHFCSGYVISDMLGEVTFVGEDNDKLSGLTIEKQAACSLYSNVDKNLLSGDFTKLGPEVMLSGIALSLTEHIL